MPARFSLPLLILLLALVAMPETAHGRKGAQNVEVALLVDGKAVGVTWVNLSSDGKILEMPAAPVLSAMAPLLSPQAVRSLEARISKEGLFRYADMVQSGIEGIFDPVPGHLTLRIAGKPRPTAPASKPVARTADTSAIPKAKASAANPIAPTREAVNHGPWTSPPMPALPRAKKDSNLAGSEAVGPWDPLPDSAQGATLAEKTASPAIKLESRLMDQSRDDLFQQIFKREAPPPPPRMEVALKVGETGWGTIWIEYSKDRSHFSLPADPVLKALKGSIKRDTWDKLSRQTNSKGNLTPEILEAAGFPTVLDAAQFVLAVSLPAQALGVQIHSLSRGAYDNAEEYAMRPNALSAFMNLHVRERINYYQNTYSSTDSLNLGRTLAASRNKEPRQPVAVDLEGAVNLSGWVIEGKAVWWEKYQEETNRISRQDVRFVRDWPKKSIRFTAGDLSFPSVGYQSFVKMGGVGVSREFSLQPHMVAYPVRDFEFFLANPSEVKVYINGRLTRVLNLSQGTHDIQGFPFVQGESEVKIEITDYAGQKQDLTFNFIHQPNLLAQGISSFSYNLGLPSRVSGFSSTTRAFENGLSVPGYQYDMDHPLFVGSYRLGITDVLTAGTYTQSSDTAGILGVMAIHAMPIGKLQGELAGSYHFEKSPGVAGGLDYTYIPKATSALSPVSWRGKVEYISPTFTRPVLDPHRLGSLTFSGSFRRATLPLTFSTTASYSLREGRSDFYSLAVSLSRSWMRGLTSNLFLMNTFNQQKMTNTQVSANVTYSFAAGYHSFLANERIERHRDNPFETASQKRWDNYTDLRWDYNNGAPFPNNPAMNASTSFGPINNEYDGGLGWKSDQGIAEVDVRRIEPAYAGASPVQQNFVDINLKTALVYVDGNVALARPISNSFLLVKGIKSEKNASIVINRNTSGYDAKSRPYLPGVVPALSAYTGNKVRLDPVNQPLGMADEKTDFLLYPTYKSGHALYFGTDAVVIGLGTLLMEPGVPVEYLSFTAVPVKGGEKEAIIGFTNSAGKFQLPRLKPGSYRISVDIDGKEKVAQFKLPDEAEGLFGLGDLILQDP